MAARDFTGEIYARLWALVEAHAPTAGAFRVGNRLKLDLPSIPKRRTGGDYASFPELIIRPTRYTESAYQTPATLGQENADETCDWTMVITQTFEARINHYDLRIDSTVEAEFLTAIRKGTAQLDLPGTPNSALPYVVGWGPIDADRTEEIYKDAERAVTRFTIPFQLQFQSPDLTV
jgi:hypothetical protein